MRRAVGEPRLLRLLVEGLDRAVGAKPPVALGEKARDCLRGLARGERPAAPDGRKEHHAPPLRLEKQAVGHRRDALLRERKAVLRTVRHADARPEQPQMIGDLGDRADGGASADRTARERVLPDRDRRRQALDRVDVRARKALEELPSPGREALDVAPLALGIERVEGERALSGPGDAREDDIAPAGQIDGDVPEVVRARAAD